MSHTVGADDVHAVSGDDGARAEMFLRAAEAATNTYDAAAADLVAAGDGVTIVPSAAFFISRRRRPSASS
jgi:hypothetical protein